MSRFGVSAMMALILLPFTGTAFAASPTEACTVLSKAQVTSALGSEVADGKYMMPTFKTTCTWNIQKGGAVTLQIQTLTFFNAGKGTMASSERSPATGVGDEAYYLGVGPTTALCVRKGSGAFKISVYSKDLSLDQRKAIEKALAQQAIAQF